MYGYLLFESATTHEITVTSASSNKVSFTAVLQTFDEENRNRRVYKKEYVQEALKPIIPHLNEGNFGGELDHPIPTSDETETWVRHATYLYKEAAFKINDLRFEGNKLIGDCETLSTPNGFILAGLIRDGVKVGFSARAIADNIDHQNGVEIVLPPITYIAFDAVSNPSHSTAKIMKVNLESYNRLAESYTGVNCKNGVCLIGEHLNRKKTNEIQSFFKNGNIIL